jgi:hypothetical protein
VSGVNFCRKYAANMNFDKLRLVADRAGSGEEEEA